MTTETTITPAAAIVMLANLVPQLDEFKAAIKEAKDNCDDGLAKELEEKREQLLSMHGDAFIAICGGEMPNHNRRIVICRAAATSPKPAEIRKLAKANRIGTSDGITLPEGRYGNLSRGKSWCRLGSGSSAQWINADNGHRVTEPGKYVVGSSDGFSRKEQTPWTVCVCCGFFCAE
jgi:hypothetical protein